MRETDPNFQFLLAEYAGLREEVKWIISQTEALENLALAASGGIWAWLITQEWNPVYWLGVWLPFLISLLFYGKRRALSASLKTVSNYILKIEAYMASRRTRL